MGSIRVPVGIFWGEEDRWVDPSETSELQKRIPGAGIEIVAGAGHFVMEDAPGEVAEVLAGFFSGEGERV